VIHFFARLALAFPNVVFCAIDVDENEETSRAYEVTCMPTFKFLKNGEVVESMEGASRAGLTKMLEKFGGVEE